MKVSSQFMSCCFALCWAASSAMLGKRTSYLEKQHFEVPLEKRFRSNVADLFLTNEISAARTRQLCEDHQNAEPSVVADLTKAGASGKRLGNIARDLLRRLKKRTAWPPLYFAKVRVFDLKLQKTVTIQMGLLLPHEVILCLVAHSKEARNLYEQSGLCQQTRLHLESVSLKL